MRAHANLLSDKRFSINQIAGIYDVDRDRIRVWLEWWTQRKFAGLEDEARSGRPPKLSIAEQNQAVETARAEPRQIKREVAEITERLKKK